MSYGFPGGIKVPARPGYCREIVHDSGRGVGFHQCGHKATRGGWCGVHHPDAVAARDARTLARWNAKDAADLRRQRAWSLETAKDYASKGPNRVVKSRKRKLPASVVRGLELRFMGSNSEAVAVAGILNLIHQKENAK
jgi:hypothetical protein